MSFISALSSFLSLPFLLISIETPPKYKDKWLDVLFALTPMQQGLFVFSLN
jgi:hypothetical protein